MMYRDNVDEFKLRPTFSLFLFFPFFSRLIPFLLHLNGTLPCVSSKSMARETGRRLGALVSRKRKKTDPYLLKIQIFLFDIAEAHGKRAFCENDQFKFS
jgi:hypothetical protein